VDQRADAGNDEDHHRRQRVEPERQIEREVADADPVEERLDDLAALGRHAGQRQHLHHGDRERDRHHRGGEAPGDRFRQAFPEERVDEEAAEREEWDER
jgi:hypothetical protein